MKIASNFLTYFNAFNPAGRPICKLMPHYRTKTPKLLHLHVSHFFIQEISSTGPERLWGMGRNLALVDVSNQKFPAQKLLFAISDSLESKAFFTSTLTCN